MAGGAFAEQAKMQMEISLLHEHIKVQRQNLAGILGENEADAETDDAIIERMEKEVGQSVEEIDLAQMAAEAMIPQAMKRTEEGHTQDGPATTDDVVPKLESADRDDPSSDEAHGGGP